MGNKPSALRKSNEFLYIVKQNNKFLPICPFIHCITGNSSYRNSGDKIDLQVLGSALKENDVRLEILDIRTRQCFYLDFLAKKLNEDFGGKLHMSVIVVAEDDLDYLLPPIKIVNSSNPLFRPGDQILGFENTNNYNLEKQLLCVKGKTLLYARGSDIKKVVIETETLDVEIGVGALYSIGKQEMHITDYNYEYKFILEGDNNGLGVVDNNDAVEDHSHTIQFSKDKATENAQEEFLMEEEKNLEKLTKGQYSEEKAAILINNQLVCEDSLDENKLMKKEDFEFRKLLSESLAANNKELEKEESQVDGMNEDNTEMSANQPNELVMDGKGDEKVINEEFFDDIIGSDENSDSSAFLYISKE